jgi:hypothetical protein
VFNNNTEEFEPKKVRAPKIRKSWKINPAERIIPAKKRYNRSDFKRQVKESLEEEDSAGQEIIDHEIENY